MINEARCNEIASARKALGLHVEVFAQYMGVQRDTVTKWEAFKVTPPATVINFARFMLDCHCGRIETSKLLVEDTVTGEEEVAAEPIVLDAELSDAQRSNLFDMLDMMDAIYLEASRVTPCKSCRKIVNRGAECGYKKIIGAWHLECTPAIARKLGYTRD